MACNIWHEMGIKSKPASTWQMFVADEHKSQYAFWSHTKNINYLPFRGLARGEMNPLVLSQTEYLIIYLC